MDKKNALIAEAAAATAAEIVCVCGECTRYCRHAVRRKRAKILLKNARCCCCRSCLTSAKASGIAGVPLDDRDHTSFGGTPNLETFLSWRTMTPKPQPPARHRRICRQTEPTRKKPRESPKCVFPVCISLTSTNAPPSTPSPALLAQSRACRVSLKSGVFGVTCVPCSLDGVGWNRREEGAREERKCNVG